jgi:hypothetical protein
MTVRMAGFTFSGRTKNSGDVVVTLNVSALREIQVTPVGLRFAGECVFEVLFGLGAFE